MTVFEIVKQYLEEHGYDGLCSDFCGCELDDLAPCGNMADDCYAAYKGPCICGEGCDFDLYDKKPEEGQDSWDSVI